MSKSRGAWERWASRMPNTVLDMVQDSLSRASPGYTGHRASPELQHAGAIRPFPTSFLQGRSPSEVIGLQGALFPGATEV